MTKLGQANCGVTDFQ